jgi:hypothetical protein
MGLVFTALCFAGFGSLSGAVRLLFALGRARWLDASARWTSPAARLVLTAARRFAVGRVLVSADQSAARRSTINKSVGK